MDGGLLQETKSVLKSLIISCPHGMTIDRLNKDYREWEGRAIPFSNLGYSNLEAFLRSLTDTLVVNGAGFNATVTAIASEKSAHIDKMVTKQKSSTRRRSRLKPDANEDHHRDNQHKIPTQSFQNHQTQQYNRQYQQQTRLHPPNQIKPPIIQNPNIYQNVFRQPQQFHPNLLPHLQQTLQMNMMQNVYRFTAPHNGYSYNNLINHPLINQQHHSLDNWQNFQYSLQATTHPTYMNYQQNIPILDRLQNINTSVPRCANPTNQIDANSNDRETPRALPHEETNMEDVTLLSNQNSQSVENDSVSNTDTTSSVTDKNFQIPDTTNMKKSGSIAERTLRTRQKLAYAMLNGSDKISSSVSTSTPTSTTDCDNRKYDLLENENSQTSKENHFNDPLGEITNDQLLELERQLDKINLNSKSKKKLPLAKINCEAVPELQKNDIVFQIDFPVDTVRYGEKIPESEFPQELLKANWFGIFITEVNNPYKFWFHFYQEHSDLDSLMHHIENIYMKLSADEMQLHRSCFKPGQVCCALFYGSWHRAEILEAPENNTVKVFFVDYGTVTKVDLNEVKFLLTEFSSLPCQAQRGCLDHIRPVEHRWSRDATYAFLDMVQDLFLYAKATEIDYKTKVVKMILTDTHNKSDYQINEALIRKGHARISSTFQANNTELKKQGTDERRKHFQELYPTHEMLERGEYPTFHEISVLKSKGIDFEALQDENIIPDIDGGHSLEEVTKKLTESRIIKTQLRIPAEPKDDPNVNINVSNTVLNKCQNSAHNYNGTIKSSSDMDTSSISSMSDNFNPFHSEPYSINGSKTKQVNSDCALNQTNVISENPFLYDDSDSENTNIKHETNQIISKQHYNPTQHQNFVDLQKNVSTQQTQNLFYGYMPHHQASLPQPPRQLPPGFRPPMISNMPAASGIVNIHVNGNNKTHRPPPGFEHFQPKPRNVFQ